MTSTPDDTRPWVPVDEGVTMSVIGEGLHTGLRKGSDAPEAPALWNAIQASDQAWTDALMYLVWGLAEMNFALCKRADA